MRADRTDLCRQRHPEPPAGDIHLVDALVADVTVAVVPVPVPVVVEPVPVEGPLGRRPEPEVVVNAGRHRLILEVADRVAPLVAEPFGHVDLSEGAAAEALDGALAAGIAPLLHAVLDDHFVLPGGLDELLAFEKVVAHGLLDGHVLAGLHRPDSRQRVPVVGRHHRDRVDVLVFEKRPHVGESFGRAPSLVRETLLDHPRKQVLVDVAQRRNFHVRKARELGNVGLPHAADPDHPYPHTIIGAAPAGTAGPEQSGVGCRRRPRNCQCQKFPSLHAIPQAQGLPPE